MQFSTLTPTCQASQQVGQCVFSGITHVHMYCMLTFEHISNYCIFSKALQIYLYFCLSLPFSRQSFFCCFRTTRHTGHSTTQGTYTCTWCAVLLCLVCLTLLASSFFFISHWTCIYMYTYTVYDVCNKASIWLVTGRWRLFWKTSASTIRSRGPTGELLALDSKILSIKQACATLIIGWAMSHAFSTCFNERWEGRKKKASM